VSLLIAKNLSTVQTDQIVDVHGPNGAGKTTNIYTASTDDDTRVSVIFQPRPRAERTTP
jgi:ABC-type lipopolysaccharide export system ATPase subunit